MEISYQNYVNKVVPMTLTANYKQQLEYIQSSPKFNKGEPQEFPGYTIITPPAKEDRFNQEIQKDLMELQDILKEQLPSDLLQFLPPDSFHLTIADLIWDQAYLNAVKENANFTDLLIEEIDRIFIKTSKKLENLEFIELEVLGIYIFPRAIAVCFLPTEKSYEKLMTIRKLIYQNKGIIKLGIEQQYDFVGHITLGYFNNIPEDLDKEKIAKAIGEINNQWLENELPIFHIKQWELREFTDMVTYIYKPKWPRITLVK